MEKLAEFVYTGLLTQPTVRRMTNAILRRISPSSVTYHDARVFLNPNDPVVSGALTFRVYEKKEIEFLRARCIPGMIFFDVGANVGLYTALSSRLVGDEGHVYSFEPDPGSFAYLEKTANSNFPDRITLKQAGLADQPGELTLYISPDNRGDNRLYKPANDTKVLPVRVEVLRFDDWVESNGINLNDRSVFIKMDVQGFEGHVLEGMEKTLKTLGKAVLMMEFWPEGLKAAGRDPKDVLKFLSASGIKIHELGTDLDNLPPIEDYDSLIKRLPGRHYTNIIGTKG